MRICGLKLTHDAAIAVIDDGVVTASIELEKLGGRRRHAAVSSWDDVDELFEAAGVAVAGCDVVSVDGWWAKPRDVEVVHPDPRSAPLRVAPYTEARGGDALHCTVGDGLLVRRENVAYRSYAHVTGHVAGAYATSPFAVAREGAYCLVWDGGTVPRLYEVGGAGAGAGAVPITPAGPVMRLIGDVFREVAAAVSPYADSRPASGGVELVHWQLAIAGKAMAYAGLGRVVPELCRDLDALYGAVGGAADGDRDGGDGEYSGAFTSAFARGAVEAAEGHGVSGADLICTVQDWLAGALVGALCRAMARGPQYPNLVVAGGCGLNIKWNAALRDALDGVTVWVPPFANDSGSALGAACSAWFDLGGRGGHGGHGAAVEWDVYCGPSLDGSVDGRWREIGAGPVDAARTLAAGHVVAVLDGRAEMGPRALGNRSLLASPCDPGVKDVLNAAKDREWYRPVAPVCLEQAASRVFAPGGEDRFMLFDHRVRAEWVDRVPGVVHLDGTARLQTVTPAQHADLAAVLAAFDDLTGVPVLCNTSANAPGHGFFSSVAEFTAWGRVGHLFHGGRLYRNDAILNTLEHRSCP